jgi:predicted RNA-binding protein YlqC (UPF0109 family)
VSTTEADANNDKFIELVEYIVRSIVDDPSQVQVTEVGAERTILCEIRVAPEEVGRVIGRKGRVINAIRTIVRAAAGRHRRRANVEILQDRHDSERGE